MTDLDKEIKEIITEAVLQILNESSDTSIEDSSWEKIESLIVNWFMKTPSLRSNILSVSDEKEGAGSTHKIVIRDKHNNSIVVRRAIAEPYAKKALPQIANLISVLSSQQVKKVSPEEITFS